MTFLCQQERNLLDSNPGAIDLWLPGIAVRSILLPAIAWHGLGRGVRWRGRFGVESFIVVADLFCPGTSPKALQLGFDATESNDARKWDDLENTAAVAGKWAQVPDLFLQGLRLRHVPCSKVLGQSGPQREHPHLTYAPLILDTWVSVHLGVRVLTLITGTSCFDGLICECNHLIRQQPLARPTDPRNYSIPTCSLGPRPAAPAPRRPF